MLSGSSPSATRRSSAREIATSSAGSSWNASLWSLSAGFTAGTVCGCALLRARVELERTGVHAVALAGRCGAVREEMAEMAAAAAAQHLGADHAVAVVLDQLDVGVRGRLVEARPAGAGLELGVRAEELGAAARAAVRAVLL